MSRIKVPAIAAILITTQAADPTGLTLEDLITSFYLNHVGPRVLRHTVTHFFCFRVAVIREIYALHDSIHREPLV